MISHISLVQVTLSRPFTETSHNQWLHLEENPTSQRSSIPNNYKSLRDNDNGETGRPWHKSNLQLAAATLAKAAECRMPGKDNMNNPFFETLVQHPASSASCPTASSWMIIDMERGNAIPPPSMSIVGVV